jgi:AcrR family transcriptional regulator
MPAPLISTFMSVRLSLDTNTRIVLSVLSYRKVLFMAPPRNTRRRAALADAAIEILGTAGIHKLSHRAVDEQAGVPAGTAANYFPRREDLLTAAAERVVELHVADMAAADRAAPLPAGTGPAGTVPAGTVPAPGTPAGPQAGPDALAELIGGSLYDAATRHRTRYLAAYELGLESTRQPALAAAMSRLGAAMLGSTVAEHRVLGLPTTPEQIQALIALYQGTLLTLVTAPPETVTPAGARALARCFVAGVLGTVGRSGA